MIESSEKPSSVWNTILTHFATALLSGVLFGVGGFISAIYLNTPQEGSPNLILLRKLGLTNPPSLEDCQGLTQHSYYGDFRSDLLDCGWWGSTINIYEYPVHPTLTKALDNYWLEVTECNDFPILHCKFLFSKNDEAYLVVETYTDRFIVRKYYTYWYDPTQPRE